MARQTYAFSNGSYNDWHRKYDGIAMIDIDAVEICQNKGCWKPLCVIEHLYDTGSDKKKYTTIVEYIGKALNVPVFLVYYKKVGADSLTFRVAQKYPVRTPLNPMSEESWLSILRDLQSNHQKVCSYGK